MKTIHFLFILAALWILGCQDKATDPVADIGPVVVDTLPPSDSSQPPAGTFIGNFAPMRIGSIWKYSHYYFSNTGGIALSLTTGTYSLTLLDTLDGLVRFRYVDSMRWGGSDSKTDTVIQVRKNEKVRNLPSPFAYSWYFPSEKVQVVSFQGELAYQFTRDTSMSSGFEGLDSSSRYIAGVGLVQWSYKRLHHNSSYTQLDSLIEYRAAP